jgi:hypothetical protein
MNGLRDKIYALQTSKGARYVMLDFGLVTDIDFTGIVVCHIPLYMIFKTPFFSYL